MTHCVTLLNKYTCFFTAQHYVSIKEAPHFFLMQGLGPKRQIKRMKHFPYSEFARLFGDFAEIESKFL